MNKQANSRQCFVCGVANPVGLNLKFFETAPGEVIAEYVVPDKYQGYPGVVHGGIVAAMLDEVASRSLISGDPPRFMYTAKLEIRYVKNVPVGRPVRLVGRAGKDRGRVATASSAIYTADGTLLAEAEALLVNLPAGVFDGVNLDEAGWKVYPDE